jgi:hypothetical protein
MRKTCAQCGRSLTIKEAVQNWCRFCNGCGAKAQPLSHVLKGRVNLSLVRKNFDRLLAQELRNTNLPPAA